jgi:GNAT superfamily N-acetyltransferase
VEAVRRAIPEDAPRFLELAWQFLNGLVSRRGGALLVAHTGQTLGDVFSLGQFDEFLCEPNRLILMGTLGDVVTGTALAHIELLDDGRRLGHLDGCYVEPEARGVGLGQLLVDSVVVWLEECGCIGVDGMALPGDREAKNFFETSGFKARVLTMHRSFD